MTPTPQPGAADAPFSDAPFGTAHRILTSDTQYVGPHRRYNACLGCFEENATRLQEQDAQLAELTRQRDELLAALEIAQRTNAGLLATLYKIADGQDDPAWMRMKARKAIAEVTA